MTTLALLLGIWTTTCTQTQIAGVGQGFVRESYEFALSGDYEFAREWFVDADCIDAKGKDLEKGSIKLGSKMTGMFITGETFQADFISAGSTDLGAVSIKEGPSIRIARGVKGSAFRNTMVGLFNFVKR